MQDERGLWRGVQAHLERARRGLDGVFGVDQSVTDKVLGLRRICFDATCYVLEAARSRTFSVFVWSSLSLNKRPDIGGGTCNMTWGREYPQLCAKAENWGRNLRAPRLVCISCAVGPLLVSLGQATPQMIKMTADASCAPRFGRV